MGVDSIDLNPVAGNVGFHAGADDHAVVWSEAEEAGKIGRDGGCPNDRRLVRRRDVGLRHTRRAEPFERLGVSFRGKILLVGERTRFLRKDRNYVLDGCRGKGGLVSPRTNPWTVTLLPVPSAIVITRESASAGVRAKLRSK